MGIIDHGLSHRASEPRTKENLGHSGTQKLGMDTAVIALGGTRPLSKMPEQGWSGRLSASCLRVTPTNFSV